MHDLSSGSLSDNGGNFARSLAEKDQAVIIQHDT